MPLYLKWPSTDAIRRRGGKFPLETGVYLEKKGWIQGHISEKITDLEFENHKDVKKCILLTLKQAEANICSMGYQNSNLKIGLSLFGCPEKYTEKVHIVQCECVGGFSNDLLDQMTY